MIIDVNICLYSYQKIYETIVATAVGGYVSGLTKGYWNSVIWFFYFVLLCRYCCCSVSLFLFGHIAWVMKNICLWGCVCWCIIVGSIRIFSQLFLFLFMHWVFIVYGSFSTSHLLFLFLICATHVMSNVSGTK